MTEFSRTAAVVATNIQKLVQNVSSMQRMLVHVDTQGEGLMQQLRQLQHYTWQLARDTTTQLKQLADSQPAVDSGANLQSMLEEEEKINQLQDRERSMRQLESIFKVGSTCSS